MYIINFYKNRTPLRGSGISERLHATNRTPLRGSGLSECLRAKNISPLRGSRVVQMPLSYKQDAATRLGNSGTSSCNKQDAATRLDITMNMNAVGVTCL